MCNRYTPARGADPIFDLLGRPVANLPPEPLWRTIGPRAPGPFIRPGREPGTRETVIGQWGLIRPGSPTRVEIAPDKRPKMTNNARSETMRSLPTFREAWKNGQRCIIPAVSYDEPNWESGKNVWWSLRRADGHPWGIAGLWSEWTDPATGEVVPSYTMVTVNVDDHPLLNRLHRPDPKRPPGKQDKRAVLALDPADWVTWVRGSNDDAWGLLRPLPAEHFDAGPTDATPVPPAIE